MQQGVTLTDDAAVRYLRSDPVLARIMEGIGPLMLRPRLRSPFESLVHAIIHQQLSGRAASTILLRFRNLYQCDGFPDPAAVVATQGDALRSAGLSSKKVSYIRDVAERCMDGTLPSLDDCGTLSDAELVERLMLAKGVGLWTAQMLLIFNLGRPDILPVHDLGIRRGFQIAYRRRTLPEARQLERRGQRWAPYRTTAALYLWRTADFLKDGEW